MTLSRPATVSALASGAVCNSHKMRGRKLKTEGRAGATFEPKPKPIMTSHPNNDEWTAEDIANERRTAANVQRSLERMHVKMVLWVAVVAVLLGVAIHFLGKQ